MTLYLDMDGVLADFFSGFAKKFGVKHWKDIPDINVGLTMLQHTDFFNVLDKCQGADELIAFAKSTGDWGICSSPLRNDHFNSAYWKRVWLTKYDFMPEVSKCIFTTQKYKYAVDPIDGSPNILVDDKPDNIKKWIDAGGIGIIYQANQDSLEDLLIELESKI